MGSESQAVPWGLSTQAQQVSHAGASRCSERCRAPTVCTCDLSTPAQVPFSLVPDNRLLSIQQSGQLSFKKKKKTHKKKWSFSKQDIVLLCNMYYAGCLANSAVEDVAL